MPTRAIPEIALPFESLLRLQGQGPRAAGRLERLAVRGDWRTRSMAVSALGSLVRDDPTAWRERGFWRYARNARIRRVGLIRRLLPTSGARGDLVRHTMINALCDRSWIVRTAAALAVGECRDRALAGVLRPLLSDPFRPVRLAAAAALAAMGATGAPLVEATLAGAEPAPLRIGEDESGRAWVERLVAAHRTVVEALAGEPGLETPPAGAEAGRWAAFLSGPVPAPPAHDIGAEVRRHAAADEVQYNATKPFAPGHREQNTRLLHSFLVLAEQLDAPVGARIVDLGGGGGWVSELLAKLGYRPVTVDIAPALLRVAGDRFARERLPWPLRERRHDRAALRGRQRRGSRGDRRSPPRSPTCRASSARPSASWGRAGSSCSPSPEKATPKPKNRGPSARITASARARSIPSR